MEAGDPQQAGGENEAVHLMTVTCLPRLKKMIHFKPQELKGWAGTAEDGREQPAQPGLRQQNPQYGNKPLQAAWLRLIRCQGASTQVDKEGQIIHLAQTGRH